MSTEPAPPTLSRPPAVPAGVHPVLVATFGALLVGAALKAFFLAHPAEPDRWEYADVAAVPGWWAIHFYGGLGAAVLYAAFAVLAAAVCLRAGPARDVRLWVAAGAPLLAAGGVLFALGVAMEGAVFAYATDPAALPPEQGAAFLAAAVDRPERYLPAILVGSLVAVVGALCLSVALWRSGAVRRLLVGALLAGLVLGPVFPSGPVGIAVTLVLEYVPVLAVGVLAIGPKAGTVRALLTRREARA